MNAGIVCDLNFTSHIGISIYYYAIKNLFNNVKIIKNVDDLKNINILFIGNEHFHPHRIVWEQNKFQAFCNENKIKVVVFSSERIFNSAFPHNEQIQRNLIKFNNLFQFNYDADDLDILKTTLFRPCISRNYHTIIKNTDKIDKCVFLGNTDCLSYNDRVSTFNQVRKVMEIVTPPRKESWYDYIQEISKYKYVLSLLGNANGLNLRFYETLLVNSIPIQQVKGNTLKYYDLESKFKDCIFFENEMEIPNKINEIKVSSSNNNLFLEDHIESLLQSQKII
jgi:hypothetical protein